METAPIILMLMHLQMLLREKKSRENSTADNSQILDNRSKKDPQEENVEGF